MNKKEKLDFQQSIEDYFEKNRVFDFFEKLLKDLIIYKPDNPIDYLIERIPLKDVKRIFISGFPGAESKEIGLSLADHLDYSCVPVGDLIEKEIRKKNPNQKALERAFNSGTLAEDFTIIELLKKELISLEKERTSYIIVGFPRTRIQAMFLQNIGIVPDNLIVLSPGADAVKDRLKAKSADPDFLYNELRRNVEAVKDCFTNYYSEIDSSAKSKSNIIDDLARMLKFKAESSRPRLPPRILLIGPPSSGKFEIASIIAAKYNIVHVSISDLLKREIRKKNENSQEILYFMDRGELVPEKFVQTILEERLLASDCLINGWILTGFPKSLAQLFFLANMNHRQFKPTLLVMLEMDEEFLIKSTTQRRIDESTGIVYRNENEAEARIKERLTVMKKDEDFVFFNRLSNWKKMVSELLSNNEIKLVTINGEAEQRKLIDGISDAIERDN